MESIVQFELEDVVCNCSLNKRGRRRYGTLEDLLATDVWAGSTVGTEDGDVLLPDIRKSKHFRSVLEFSMDFAYVESELKRLAPKDKQKFVRWFDSDTVYDVIEYLPGGFFKEHVDSSQHLRHYATILIFPPAVGPFTHTGGELLITNQEGAQFTFHSSTNRKWTFVAFHLGLKHECMPVLSGKRVVIKAELLYSKLTLEAEAELERARNTMINYPVVDRVPVFVDRAYTGK